MCLKYTLFPVFVVVLFGDQVFRLVSHLQYSLLIEPLPPAHHPEYAALLRIIRNEMQTLFACHSARSLEIKIRIQTLHNLTAVNQPGDLSADGIWTRYAPLCSRRSPINESFALTYFHTQGVSRGKGTCSLINRCRAGSAQLPDYN